MSWPPIPWWKRLREVVRHEFLDHDAQVPLTKQDEVVEAPVPDRPDEPFRVRIAVRAAGRDPHALDAHGLDHVGEIVAEQRVAIVQQDLGFVFWERLDQLVPTENPIRPAIVMVAPSPSS